MHLASLTSEKNLAVISCFLIVFTIAVVVAVAGGIVAVVVVVVVRRRLRRHRPSSAGVVNGRGMESYPGRAVVCLRQHMRDLQERLGVLQVIASDILGGIAVSTMVYDAVLFAAVESSMLPVFFSTTSFRASAAHTSLGTTTKPFPACGQPSNDGRSCTRC